MDRDKGPKPVQQREPSGELLGPYALLTEIARGRLTTVHLAKKHGALGFQRLVAVKRLRPQFSRHEASVRMLVDEARLTAGLHHANLLGVLDVGSEGGCYVVSDYVEGANLATLLARAGRERQLRYILPVIADALNGLHAAHTALGEDEIPLGIVHQAPHARHLQVGVDGTGRIADFSQAAARTVSPSRARSERLELAYMAPEQALCPEAVDHRADLFCMGITLWEALTGESLFAAADDERTFQNLLHRRIPRPSEVGLNPPRCFDAVCMRALERDPTHRYASALEMARELRDTALNQALYATAGEIGRWVRSLVGPELLERRRTVGADTPSQELLLASTRSSGYFEALGGDEELTGGGRTHGGSYSMFKRDDGSAGELDKTPALGMRGGRYGASTAPRDEGAADEALAGRASDLPGEATRARKPTVSYPAIPELDELATETNLKRPRLDITDDPEHTQPGSFVPSRPGARRDSNLPSPGAYSQISSPRRPRKSAAPDQSESGLRRSSAPPPTRVSFEELDTGRFRSIPPEFSAPPASAAPIPPPRASSLPPPGRVSEIPPVRPSDLPPARARTSSNPPPLPSARNQQVKEAQPVYVSRRDSVPARMALPEGPVGVPHAEPSARSSFPSDLPKAPAILEDLRPEARFERQVAPRQADGPQSSVGVMPDSLVPPTTAARTVPPHRDDDARGRGRGRQMWTGAAAAVIIAAFGAGLKHWVVDGRGAPATAPVQAAQLPETKAREIESPTGPAQPAQPAPAGARADQVVAHAAHEPATPPAGKKQVHPSQARHGAKAGAPNQLTAPEPAAAIPAASTQSPAVQQANAVPQPPASAAPQQAANAQAANAVEEATNEEKPAEKPVKHTAKASVPSAIPENPY